MTRPWNPVQVKQLSKHDSKKPKDQTREDENSKDPVRKLSNLAGQGASSNPKRNWQQGPTCRWGKTLEDSGTDTEQRRLRARPKWAQAGRLSPFRGPDTPPDLAVIRAIYSPEAGRHTSTHSSSTAEEQWREGHHLGEERVELVD
jgi:hypothetical protein